MWYDLCVLAALALANFSCLLLLTEKKLSIQGFKNFLLTSYPEFCTVEQYLALVGVDKTRCFPSIKMYRFCKLCSRDTFAFGCWCYKIFYDVGAQQYFLSGGDKSNCCYTKYCVFMLSKRDLLVFIIHRLLIKIPKQQYSSKVLNSLTNSGVVYCKELLLEPIITSLSSLSLSLLSKLASSFSSAWSQQREGWRWVSGWVGRRRIGRPQISRLLLPCYTTHYILHTHAICSMDQVKKELWLGILFTELCILVGLHCSNSF